MTQDTKFYQKIRTFRVVGFIWVIKRANWVGLNNDLSRVDWHYLLDNSEPDIAWNTFKNK